ncbi:MAPEG family protein [Methylocapsa sp. S129]|uniref:MAPEG family protein n=1 Tax=Methylocapsa sp. S129 TaxID=1641869 RepID=UPI00131E5502|nr:MAPEG family protein [Methylocapsa sp. S129]
MTIAIWCILIAALLPYLVFGPASAKLNIKLPRGSSAQQLEGLPARAYGAHLNHFETFPFFAAAVIVAHMLEGASATVNWLAVAYIVIRLFYTAMYLTDRQPLRSASFFLGLLVAIAIFVTPAFH